MENGRMISKEYIIKDWCGNIVFEDENFCTFDEAEDFLGALFREIGADYEEERGEFFIERKYVQLNRKH